MASAKWHIGFNEAQTEGTNEMKTASEIIALAIANKATVTVDHSTKKFVGYAIDFNNGSRRVVVRVHVDGVENNKLSEMLA